MVKNRIQCKELKPKHKSPSVNDHHGPPFDWDGPAFSRLLCPEPRAPVLSTRTRLSSGGVRSEGFDLIIIMGKKKRLDRNRLKLTD